MSPEHVPDPDAAPGVSPPAATLSLRTLRSLFREGMIGEALARADSLRTDPAFATADPLRRAVVQVVRVECRLARGDLVEAMDAGDELTELLPVAGATGAVAHYGKGELTAALGDPALSYQHFRSVEERLHDEPVPAALLPWRVGACLALLHTRERGAQALGLAQLEAVTDSGSPPALALALRTLAACDQGGRRVDLLREARSLLDGVPAQRLAAQIDTDLAALLALNPDPDSRVEALALLRAAESYAGRERLWPLRGRVRRVLDRLGQNATPAPSEALGSLTRAERRVAAYAAQGWSNRAIAEHLGVGVKSVEWHLSRVYRKLGISSRADLAPIFGAPV